MQADVKSEVLIESSSLEFKNQRPLYFEQLPLKYLFLIIYL